MILTTPKVLIISAGSFLMGFGSSEFCTQSNSHAERTFFEAHQANTTLGKQRLISNPLPTITKRFIENDSPVKDKLTLERVLKITGRVEQVYAMEHLGLLMAKDNLEAAFTTLNELKSREHADAFIRGIFQFLGNGDRKFALTQVSLIKSSRNREAALGDLAIAWGLDKTFDYYNLDHDPVTNGALLLELDPPQTELAIAWADQLGPTESKGKLLEKIAQNMLPSSPTEAFKLGNKLAGEDYLDFLDSVTESWSSMDPEAVLAWTMEIQDSTLRTNLQQILAKTWPKENTEQARTRLQTLPENTFRDSLLNSVAERMAFTDTVEAFRWQAGLPDPSDRAQAQKIIENAAPIGIGAGLTIRNGLPVIETLVGNAPATLSGQLQEGDRIVAVDSLGNGQFVTTQGLGLQEVISLIRGKTGTSVQLQVTKVNADGYDNVRTVNLMRKQIIFKP